jgi:endogenous inhibitor of DNA gyrase (YacG/DUF329 family)
MVVTVKCPSCKNDSQMSFTSESYIGPFRCWKCAKLYMIRVIDGNLESCEAIDSHPAVEKSDKTKDAHEEMKSKWSVFLPPSKRPPGSPLNQP